MRSVRLTVSKSTGATVNGGWTPRQALLVETRPFYEGIQLRRFAIMTSLLTVSVSLWFYSAAKVRIAVIPPDAFFYARLLPGAYWLGLISTLVLLLVGNWSGGRAKTFLDLASLFMLCLYLIGLPSFVYQNPRFLDSYQHEGNALSFLFSGGWLNNSVWYLYQFPGAYVFFADLTAVAGVDPFQLMLYYPAVVSLIVAFFVYVIARLFSIRYSTIASAIVISGFWFQLHLSPQSIELIPYLGIIYLLLKMFHDRTRWRLLRAVAIACVPVFVFSHPESSLVTSIGLIVFLILEPIVSSGKFQALRSNFSVIGAFVLALVVTVVVWWTVVASGALHTVLQVVNTAVSGGIAGITHGPKAPPTPSPSYRVSVGLEEAMSVTIWTVGLSLLVFVRRFRKVEYFLAALFLAAIATIPVAIFGNPDVLQRSYMFALFPLAFLSASLLEHKEVLRIGRVSLVRPLAVALMLIVIGFSIAIPVARYGGDSFQYLPESSLASSAVAASLTGHSVLIAHPDWYGIKYYGPFQGYEGAILLEQKNISGRPGAFIKLETYGSSLQYNLTFTHADATADYLSVADFFNNLYLMRFGSDSTFYLNSKVIFEANASCQFNLVYSTGTDRLYANAWTQPLPACLATG